MSKFVRLQKVQFDIAVVISAIILGIAIAVTIVCSGCACLGLPTKPTTPIIPTPIDQLWQAAKQGNWLISVSILGIAAGVFALMNGSKIGIPAAMASCVSLFMSLAVARFATWMAVFGLIGSVAICAASILLKNKALVEIIKGTQVVKNLLPQSIPVDADKIFTATDLLQREQSKSTQRLVQKTKGRLKINNQI